MSSGRTEVKVAHALFWYTDEDGRNRYALRGETIEVNDEDLKRGEAHDAFAKTDEALPEPGTPAPDAPESEKVEDIKAWVGEDPARAQEALANELAKDEGDRRSTLVDALEKVIGAGGGQ